jgi:hypothetical protein
MSASVKIRLIGVECVLLLLPSASCATIVPALRVMTACCIPQPCELLALMKVQYKSVLYFHQFALHSANSLATD